MRTYLLAAAGAAVLWVLWRRFVTRLRNRANASERLRRAAVAALTTRLETILPEPLDDGARYLVAGDLLHSGFLQGKVGHATTEEHAVAEALRYLDMVVAVSPQTLKLLIEKHKPRQRDLTSIRDTNLVNPSSADPTILLRVIEEATDLIEGDLKAEPLAAGATRTFRLCAAQCVQAALDKERLGPTSTYRLRDVAKRVLLDAVAVYGSFPNAISALAAKRQSREE